MNEFSICYHLSNKKIRRNSKFWFWHYRLQIISTSIFWRLGLKLIVVIVVVVVVVIIVVVVLIGVIIIAMVIVVEVLVLVFVVLVVIAVVVVVVGWLLWGGAHHGGSGSGGGCHASTLDWPPFHSTGISSRTPSRSARSPWAPQAHCLSWYPHVLLWQLEWCVNVMMPEISELDIMSFSISSLYWALWTAALQDL